MELQEEVLEQLKCDVCLHHLSCAPVLLSSSGKNICGRCGPPANTKSTDIFLHNKVYENLAAIILFPCKNQKQGCSVKLKVKDAKRHEEECFYNVHICPTATIDNKCKWTGRMEEIQSHYRECHPELIVEHPYSKKPDIKKDNINFLLIKIFNFLFLLQVKCIVAKNKFWHSVVFLGPPHLANLFKFKIKLQNKEAYLVRSNVVKPQKRFTMHEADSIVHVINNIFVEVGPYDVIDFELSITMKEVKCCKCDKILNCAPIFQSEEEATEYFCGECHEISLQKHPEMQALSELLKRATLICHKCDKKMSCSPILHLREEGFLCAECGSDTTELTRMGQSPRCERDIACETETQQQKAISTFIKTCENKYRGCDYKTDDIGLLEKHELWLCRFNDATCFVCSKSLFNMRWINHRADEHCIQLTPDVDGFEATVIVNLEFRGESYYAIRVHGSLFYLQIDFRSNTIIISIVCDTEKLGDQHYQCRYHITSINDPRLFTGVVEFRPDGRWDWWSDVNIDKKPIPNKCNIKIIINKIP